MRFYDAFLVFAFAFAVALNAAEKPASVKQTHQAAAQASGATFTTEVVFEKSSTNLTSDARQQLTRLLDEARHGGQLKEVKVLAWADKEYPPNKKKEPDKDQRKLADDRAFEIKGFFTDSAPGVDVDTYNMSERPTSFDKLVNSSSAQLKQKLEQAGLTDPKKGQNPPKASHALVLVILQ